MRLKKVIIFALIIIIAAGSIGFYVFYSGKNSPIYTTVLVKQGDIIQTVNEIGTVKSQNEFSLSFLNTGKIRAINYEVGNKVKTGDILAELDASALLISKNEAEAGLSAAQTNLNKLLAGSSNDDTAVSKASLDHAKAAYQTAKNELQKIKQTVAENALQANKTLNDLLLKTPADMTTYEQSIITAQTNLDNAKSTHKKAIDNSRESAKTVAADKIIVGDNALDVIDGIITDNDAKDLISVKNMEYLSSTKLDHYNAARLLIVANSSLATAKASNTNGDAEAAISDADIFLNKVYSALVNCYRALENSITSASGFPQSKLDAYKSSIVSQQTLVSAAITSVQVSKHNFENAVLNFDTYVSAAENSLFQARTAYENAIKSAENALSSAKIIGEQQVAVAEGRVIAAHEAVRIAEAQYNKIMAPADRYDVSLAQARVKQAQTSIDSINKQIENSQIISPVDGIVAKVNFKIGEQALGGTPIFSLLTQNKYEIEVLISEADIAKVKTGQNAEITLDAFGDDVKFGGEVYFMEPAETVIQGVIYYKVKMNFNGQEMEVKSGMTANATIVTAKKENILLIPSRAVIEKNGKGKIVRVLAGKRVEEKPITIGISGDDGMIEVLSGLAENEAVITYIKEK